MFGSRAASTWSKVNWGSFSMLPQHIRLEDYLQRQQRVISDGAPGGRPRGTSVFFLFLPSGEISPATCSGRRGHQYLQITYCEYYLYLSVIGHGSIGPFDDPNPPSGMVYYHLPKTWVDGTFPPACCNLGK